MINDKHNARVDAPDRLTHGAVYHMLWDRPLAEVRRRVVDYIPKGSSALDIACGTGGLCFELASLKNCRVVGLDLSKRMINFANKRNQYQEAHFAIGDAVDLSGFNPHTFDFATIILLLHEIPKPIQLATINEALRVAKKAIIIDSLAPLPKNLHGIALRIAEAIGGPKHYRSFTDYLKAGGISGILQDSSLKAAITRRSVFWHGCREMVVLGSPN
jgi:ubiquinone/menaquinone biosynthesis C-methylase UbiE